MEKLDSITLSSHIKQGKDQVCADVNGEVVMMGIESGKYFGLNNIGSRIWEIIEKPKQVAQIVDDLLEEFEVTREECETQTLSFLTQLAQNDLIELAIDPSSTESLPAEST